MLAVILTIFVILGFYLLSRYLNNGLQQSAEHKKRVDENLVTIAGMLREHEGSIRILNADMSKLNRLNCELAIGLEQNTEKLLGIFRNSIEATDFRADLQAKQLIELEENQKEIARLLRELNAVVRYTTQERHQNIIEDIKTRIEKLM